MIQLLRFKFFSCQNFSCQNFSCQNFYTNKY
nr:MAG TPA: hypothetical protein [Caudoviricetes sp.]